MNLTHLIYKPVITEKTHRQTQASSRYTFEVARNATKNQIKQAIEKYFKVTVIKINTITTKGEARRTGKRRLPAATTSTKKAIVQLKKDQTISLFNQDKDAN